MEFQYEVGMSEGRSYYDDGKGNVKNISNEERDSYNKGIINFEWRKFNSDFYSMIIHSHFL